MLGGLFSSVESGVWSVVVVQGLLIAVACLVAKHRLHNTQGSVVAPVGSELAVPRLSSTGSIVVVKGLSCYTACGIFSDQILNL